MFNNYAYIITTNDSIAIKSTKCFGHWHHENSM